MEEEKHDSGIVTFEIKLVWSQSPGSGNDWVGLVLVDSEQKRAALQLHRLAVSICEGRKWEPQHDAAFTSHFLRRLQTLWPYGRNDASMTSLTSWRESV